MMVTIGDTQYSENVRKGNAVSMFYAVGRSARGSSDGKGRFDQFDELLGIDRLIQHRNGAGL